MFGARPMRSVRRMQNLSEGRPPWYRITNAATVGAPTQVAIYSEIGFLGVPAADFMAELAGVNGDIELHLNSPGGDVFDGIAIYNQLKQRKGSVHVIVDGLAASAASFIAQAASPGKLEMSPHSQLMIHDGFGMGIGNAADMRQLADLLDKASDNIAGIYADRTGQPASTWRDRMRTETWYSDKEAVAAGLADRIHGDAERPEDAWDLSVFARYGSPDVSNAKYKQDDRDRMAKSGQAMPDGSYPIADEEDLHNAIHAVGRGSGDHDAIRKHIIKRADALGLSSAIPDNWNADGSVSDGASNQIDPGLLASVFTTALEGGKAA